MWSGKTMPRTWHRVTCPSSTGRWILMPQSYRQGCGAWRAGMRAEDMRWCCATGAAGAGTLIAFGRPWLTSRQARGSAHVVCKETGLKGARHSTAPGQRRTIAACEDLLSPTGWRLQETWRWERVVQGRGHVQSRPDAGRTERGEKLGAENQRVTCGAMGATHEHSHPATTLQRLFTVYQDVHGPSGVAVLLAFALLCHLLSTELGASQMRGRVGCQLGITPKYEMHAKPTT